MKGRKKLINSQWRLSVMALAVFIGGSIGSQLVSLPDVPYLPPIYGALTGSVLLVVGNAIYVLYKRKKKNVEGKENQG